MSKITNGYECEILEWQCQRSLYSLLYFSFWGSCKASDLLNAFKESILPLSLRKVLKASVDCPNTSQKFLKDLKIDFKNAGIDTKILDLGSCGLYVGNNDFKTGIT